MVKALNLNCIPQIPEKGSVGASGDLCPLAHMAHALCGFGHMWDPLQEKWSLASEVMKKFDIPVLELGPKEGLALINGTSFITAITAIAATKALHLFHNAIAVGALTTDSMKGTPLAFYPQIHRLRPHRGQKLVAEKLLSWLTPESQICKTHASKKVQDCYSLRCTPQVMGVVHDKLYAAMETLNIELNSVTDNPLIFPDADIAKQEKQVISGGNFHGQYPAVAADDIAIALSTLVNLSERKIAKMIDKNHNGNLHSCLTPNPGLNSGFMIPQYVAAALASENRLLANPSSVHSLPTCENFEDHVSMGAYAARKCHSSLENARYVVGIELMLACQAVDLLHEKTTDSLQKIVKIVREKVPKLENDRFLHPDINECVKIVQDYSFDDLNSESLLNTSAS
jgi:histidine ammonia-lyase